MNAPQEEASEFSKVSKRENRVYVGNLAYDVKYGDLIEFMKPGGWKRFSRLLLWFRSRFGVGLVLGSVCGDGAAAAGLWRPCSEGDLMVTPS